MDVPLSISLIELFERIQAGKDEAFGLVFSHYYDRIYATALQYCKVETVAEDVAQQVFLKIWEKRDSLTGVRDPEGWLFTLARNQVLDVMREQTRSRRYTEYISEVFLEEEASPEQLMINRQRRDLLKRGLQELSPKQQEIYRLNREQGFTYDEIAGQLGIGRETVKEHMGRALSRIRQFIADHRRELISLFIAIACQLNS